MLALGEGLGGAHPAFWRWARALPGLGEELLSALCTSRMEKTGSRRRARAGSPRSRGHGPLAQLLWAAMLLPLWGKNRPRLTARCLQGAEAPYSVHSHQLRIFRGPQLLGPQRQPSLCRCLTLSRWPQPLAGTAVMLPAAGLSRLRHSLDEQLLHPHSPGVAAVAAEHGHPVGASG